MKPKPRVETYRVTAAPTGRPARRATKVTLPCGRVVRFFDLLPAREAVRQAVENVARRPDDYPLPKEG